MSNQPTIPSEPKHWTVDKRVNITHLLATAALCIAAFQWGSAIETRVAVIEDRQITQTMEIIRRLERIERLMDRD